MNAPASAQSRRAVTAAVIGNVLEWYDFAVYAYVAAVGELIRYARSKGKVWFATHEEVARYAKEHAT